MARLSDSITYGNHAITGDVNVGGTLTVDGDVYLGGTVDGRNVSSDGSKLDNIESNATADQTKADIDALNIDADTLDGIDSTGFATSAQGDTADSALQSSDIGVSVQAHDTVLDNTTASYTTAEETKLSGIEDDATADQTDSEIKIAYEANVDTNEFSDAEKTKLSNIEANATADVGSYSTAESDSRYLNQNGGTVSGNLVVDNGQSTNLTVVSDSDGVASLNAQGGSQGTGVLYAGQTLDHGGGIFYNGDGSPSYASGGAADRVSLFRRSGGTNHVVMSYSHNNSDVSFTGNVTASGNITAYSDKRLKKDLVVIPTATDKVKQLAGYTYTNINNGSRNTGVVAQEVQKVLPEAVHEDDEGILSVAYGNMVGLLIESIKEQQIQIDELKRRIG